MLQKVVSLDPRDHLGAAGLLKVVEQSEYVTANG